MTDRNRKRRISIAEVLVIALLAVLGAKALHTWVPSVEKDGGSEEQVLRPEPAGKEGTERSTEELYREIYESLAAREREIEFDYDCSGELFGVFKQVLADHPELFWFPGSGSLIKKTSGAVTTVTFRPDVPIDDDEITGRTDAMEARAREILSRCASGGTLYDRLLILHDILVDETDYDSPAAEQLLGGNGAVGDEVSQSASVYGCLVNRRAVCSGYAAAFQLLASRLGTECRRVQGTELRSGAPHEWNLLLLGEDWVHVDVTWDDPIFSGEAAEGYRSYDYFCVTTAEILKTHLIDDADSLPPCVSEEYGYYRRLGYDLDRYDFDEASAILSRQLEEGAERVYLKFPDAETAEEALDDLLTSKRLFSVPAVKELGIRSAGGTASDTGTVCLWMIR